MSRVTASFLVTATVVAAVALAACKPAEPAFGGCPSVPVVEGAKTVRTSESGVMLRLPDFASVNFARDCKTVQFAVINYLWVDGKLVSAAFQQDAPPAPRVWLMLSDFGNLSELKRRLDEWRFDNPVRHSKYPLDLYPKFYWSGPASAPRTDPPDTLWGVRGTKSPITATPFLAMCSISRADPTKQLSISDGEFFHYGDSKCRGSVHAVVNGKVAGGLIDVWADGAPEIDKIYAAVQLQLQEFIKGN